MTKEKGTKVKLIKGIVVLLDNSLKMALTSVVPVYFILCKIM